MMKRYHQYIQENPLPAWLLSTVLLLLFNLTVFWVVPGTKNPALFMLMVCLAISPPTRNLIHRFSDEQRHEKPIPPQQEAWVGILALLTAACSIGALGAVIFGKHVGLVLPADTGVWLIMAFSGSAVLSLALGYATRHTKTGRWGLTLTVTWLLLLISFVLARITMSLLQR